jgi:hypothetical protein
MPEPLLVGRLDVGSAEKGLKVQILLRDIQFASFGAPFLADHSTSWRLTHSTVRVVYKSAVFRLGLV